MLSLERKKSHINLSAHFKNLEQRKINSKQEGRKKIRIRAKISEIEKRKKTKSINQRTGSLKRSVKLICSKTDKMQITNMKNETDIMTNHEDIKRVIRDCYDYLCKHVFDKSPFLKKQAILTYLI